MNVLDKKTLETKPQNIVANKPTQNSTPVLKNPSSPIIKSELKKTADTPKFKSPISSFFKKRIDTAFGMDISDSSIELMEFNVFFSHKPRSYSRIHLERGIVERGKILKKDILEQKIKTLLQSAKPKKVSTNRVMLSLPEAQVFTWSTAFDKSISGSDLKNRIFEEAKKNVPLDFKKIYWDFVTYPVAKKELQYVTFVAISQEVLNEYVEICHKQGLEVVDLSLVSMCLAKVFLPPVEKDTHIILDIGGEKTNISIFEGNNLLKLSATMQIAGHSFNKKVADELKISEFEAEELKIKFGLSNDGPAEYKSAIQNIVDELITEIKQSIQYYEKNSGETVDAIYLTGGSSIMSGLDRYIETKLGVKIEPLASLPFITKSSIFTKEINLKLFINAVGLALLGITKNNNTFSFKKQIANVNNKMGFWQILQTGNFNTKRMIFAYTHLAYGGLTLLVVILTTVFTWMYLDITGKTLSHIFS